MVNHTNQTNCNKNRTSNVNTNNNNNNNALSQKPDIFSTKYIIFSDIDDTLYTNTFMTKKIQHTHKLIQQIENKHIVFISARPEVSFLRYLTQWRLKKDFNNFTLLMGSFASVIWYIFMY